MGLATIHYEDQRHYGFVEASDAWKAVCSHFPSFEGLAWDNYDQKTFLTLNNDGHTPLVLDGKEVIVQLWKGLIPKSQKTPFADELLGGVGAEIGIYRADNGVGWLLKKLVDMPPQLWWPYPELGATMQYRLVNPITGEVFFDTRPETGYWTCKWIDPESYKRYVSDQKALGKEVPGRPTQYRMEATVFGKDGKNLTFTWT